MEIDRVYTVDSNHGLLFVYDGRCDGIPTKWITQGKWDFNISVQYDSSAGEMLYSDGKGKPMLVYEKGEAEYAQF